MKRLPNLFLAATLFVLIPASSAWASDILVILDRSTLDAMPGDVLTFTGTLQNLDSSIVDLNLCQINMTGQFVTDCSSPFLTNAPLTLNPLDTSADFIMFTITVNLPYTDALGPQSGSFDVLGGVEGPGGYDPTTQNLLGTADFSVNVVPEPGTAGLWLLAGAVMLAMSRRRHKLIQ